MAPVCRFWQQGNCRFGDRCKFQHYEEQSRPSSGNSFGGNQRAEPLSSRNNSTYQSGNSSYQSGSNTRQSGTSAPQTLPFILNKDAILTDLTTEKPQWILSAYGPGSRAPAQLFGGPMREQSFEEMRLRHYIAMANGNPQQAILEAQQLYQEAEQQIKNAVNNIGGAIDYILNAAKEHPNRVDIVNESSKSSVGPLQPNPFNNPKPFLTPIANPFGAPSSQPAAPAFGAPSAPTGAFGQPSNLGQSQNPFGSPTPPFGAPSQPPGAIGRPSLLGQKPNPFGAPSGSSASPFSTPAPTATPFGQPSQPPAGNAFGAPSSQPNPFGAAPGGGPFGQPPPAPGRPSGGQPANPSPFGASSAPPPTSFGGNSFSPSPAAHANPFGQGQAAQVNPSPFGQAPNQPALNANPFGQKPSSFGAPSMSAMNGSGSSDEMSQHAPLNSYCTKDSDGRLTMWKGRRVEYKIIDEVNVPGYTKDGKWIKIWFPNGPHMDKDISMSEGTEYDQETIDAYAYASKHGRFKGGLLPKLPPKPEWIKYDF